MTHTRELKKTLTKKGGYGPYGCADGATPECDDFESDYFEWDSRAENDLAENGITFEGNVQRENVCREILLFQGALAIPPGVEPRGGRSV